jgi:CRISPR-associated exonuclease Cas4
MWGKDGMKDTDDASKNWVDEDWVSLSAVQHFGYCPRQYALIYKEQIFQENVYTMSGRMAHARADEPGETVEDGVPVLRALQVWSDRYGLSGRCDVVEWRSGAPYPVEYKRGPLKASIHDDLQLCAQALCLEDMFHTDVSVGAIYHISSRHRREVAFDRALRAQVLDVAEQIRALKEVSELPPAVNDRRCTHCSLIDACLPELTDARPKPSWVALLEKEGILP